MKLKKTKRNSEQIGTVKGNSAGGSYIAIILLSLMFFLLWYNVGIVGRVFVAVFATLVQGPSSILLQCFFISRRALRKHELIFGLSANIVTTGGLSYMTFVFSGSMSKLIGLDAVTLMLAAMFTILGTFSWFFAKKVLVATYSG